MVSVQDITLDHKAKRWPDITNESSLKEFMESSNRAGVDVRLYLAEYQGSPAPGMIETLGGGLRLDPRFFHWASTVKGMSSRLRQDTGRRTLVWGSVY